MANLLENMRTLQVDYSIPMRMDIGTHNLIKYYNSFKNEFDAIEKFRLIEQVIADLEKREQSELSQN